MKSSLTAFLFFFLMNILHGQQQKEYPVTDSMPAVLNGLKAGYTITETSEKEVGDKGKFSRYKLKFWIINTAEEAKILMQKPGFFNSGSASPNLAYFKCSNATGARFTNKNVTLTMPSCVIEAIVEDKECGSDKTVKHSRLADIGYWIKPGQTISSNTIMITPLNEKPNVTVVFYPWFNGIVGVPVTGPENGVSNASPGFVKIKNFAVNKYLNNQNGPLSCTDIEQGWWSAQWEILPVSGTNNFLMRNRWKNNFITTDNNSKLSDNSQNAKAMWMIEETSTSNTFYIKNVADNSKLVYEKGELKITNSYNGNEAAAEWIVEK